MEEIINKVAGSGLVEINLEDFYDHSDRIGIDMKDFLSFISMPDGDAYLLKEKVFREKLMIIDKMQYRNKLVYIFCSVDAIIPTWAYMLLTLTLAPVAKKIYTGNSLMMEQILFFEALNKINPLDYQDAKVVVKGCSKFNVPLNAFCELVAKLQPYVKSIMYGEPCSTVPLYKKPK